MSPPPDVEYKVILLFPGYGSERETAEDILEQALDHLNIPNYEPGFRFAPNVRAHLEIVGDIETAEEKLETDDDLALIFLHDLAEDDRDRLTRLCNAKGVAVCHSIEVDEPESDDEEEDRYEEADQDEFDEKPKKQKQLHLYMEKIDPNKPRANRIRASTLTAPPEGDAEEMSMRFSQVIAMLALGVMEHHWNKHSSGFNIP